MTRRSRYILPLAALIVLAALIALGMRVEPDCGGLCINELLANASGVNDVQPDGDTAEWIELYNASGSAINLSGYGLSDDPDDPFLYVFGDVDIAPEGYVVASTDSPDAPLGFRLSSRGGLITLTAPDGSLVDEFDYGECYNEIPYGRAYDGGEPALLSKATPGGSNSAARISRFVTDAVNRERPEFSLPGGYYDEPFLLTIDHPEGTTVYYTTDGTTPDYSSKVYTEPIYIDDISPLPNRYAGILTTVYKRPLSEFGATPVTKGTVIRARISRDGQLSEFTRDATYFVGQEPEATTVSVITDPDNLFGYYNGIYVAGAIGSYVPLMPYDPDDPNGNYIFGNYLVRGKETARPASFEIFSADTGFCAAGQSGEVRLNGGQSSSSEQTKSLRMYATSKYGDSSSFDVSFAYSDSRPTRLRQLVVRTKRNIVTGILEDIVGTVPFLNDNMYVQCFEPAVLYINGEYWGIAALRERITAESIAERFGLNPKEVALIKYSDRTLELVSGEQSSLDSYRELQDYPLTHDMTLRESYDYVAERVDLDSFCRAWAAHIFFSCTDWPDNNVRAFRTEYTDPENPYADGRWRFALYDMDYSCVDYIHNTLLYAMGIEKDRGSSWIPPGDAGEWSTSLFKGLMDNADFRAQFLEVYKQYRREIFMPERLHELLDSILDGYGSELEGHVRRWSTTPNAIGRLLNRKADSAQGLGYLEVLREFFDNRLQYMDGYMEEFYSGKGEAIFWD